MRLWTILDALAEKTKSATKAELVAGTVSTPRTIQPNIFYSAVDDLSGFDLIWSNANGIDNQTSVAGDNFDVGLSKPTSAFAGVLVEFRAVYNNGQRVYANTFFGATGMYGVAYSFAQTGNPIMVFRREFWPLDDNTMRFTACTRMTSNGANVVGSDTGCLVPLRIWGIKR